ncbi:MAG: hypothetical protein JXR97_06225 [Planctomycetes bacterium]|nr:hypothetical protein [Planctomycetota bacterium]
MSEIMALRRSFTILGLIENEGAVRFKRISEEIPEASNSTLSRLLTSLTELGAIEKHGRMYTIGRIPGNSPSDHEKEIREQKLLEHMLPVLKSFTHDTGFSCGIFAPLNRITMKIACKVDSRIGTGFSHPGFERPMLPTHGFAQMFLAWKPVELQKTVYHLWRDYNSAKTFTMKSYLDKLKRIRKDGYCIENAEVNLRIDRITAPVFSPKHAGPRFVFGFNAPAGVIAMTNKSELAERSGAVRKTAEELTRLCGIHHQS